MYEKKFMLDAVTVIIVLTQICMETIHTCLHGAYTQRYFETCATIAISKAILVTEIVWVPVPFTKTNYTYCHFYCLPDEEVWASWLCDLQVLQLTAPTNYCCFITNWLQQQQNEHWWLSLLIIILTLVFSHKTDIFDAHIISYLNVEPTKEMDMIHVYFGVLFCVLSFSKVVLLCLTSHWCSWLANNSLVHVGVGYPLTAHCVTFPMKVWDHSIASPVCITSCHIKKRHASFLWPFLWVICGWSWFLLSLCSLPPQFSYKNIPE